MYKSNTFNIGKWMITPYPNGVFQFFFHNLIYVNCQKEFFISIWFRASILPNQFKCRRSALYISFLLVTDWVMGTKKSLINSSSFLVHVKIIKGLAYETDSSPSRNIYDKINIFFLSHRSSSFNKRENFW